MSGKFSLVKYDDLARWNGNGNLSEGNSSWKDPFSTSMIVGGRVTSLMGVLPIYNKAWKWGHYKPTRILLWKVWWRCSRNAHDVLYFWQIVLFCTVCFVSVQCCTFCFLAVSFAHHFPPAPNPKKLSSRTFTPQDSFEDHGCFQLGGQLWPPTDCIRATYYILIIYISQDYATFVSSMHLC